MRHCQGVFDGSYVMYSENIRAGHDGQSAYCRGGTVSIIHFAPRDLTQETFTAWAEENGAVQFLKLD